MDITQQKVRVFIVDDHQMVVDGIQSLLANHSEIVISGQTNHPLKVLALLSENPTDILITDVQMPDMNGIELTQQVKQAFPQIKVICISMHSDRFVISEMIKSGISAFILKNMGKEELITAITQVANGKNYFSEDITKEMMNSFSDKKSEGRLTQREIEIIKLIEKELSNKQIADKLFISERTVETHRKNIFRKTATQNVVGLIKYAYSHQLIQTTN